MIEKSIPKSMSPTQLIIIGAIMSLITSAYFYENYQEKRLEYETKKLEIKDKEDERSHSSEEKLELICSNNQLAMAAVERFRDNSYRALKTPRLNGRNC